MNEKIIPLTDTEIRAWDTETNKMISWEQLMERGEESPMEIWCALQEHGYKRMFATPFRDKNGTRIYEGDILRHIEYGELVTWYLGMRNGDFEGYFAKVEYIGDPNGYGLKASCAEDLEIIGNIFENPEIIEQHFYKKVRGFKDPEKCEHEWRWYSAVMYSSPLQRDRMCTKCLKVERHQVADDAITILVKS